MEQSDEDEEILCVDQSHAETPFFHVAWNEKGQFTSIYDKKANRELLPAGEKGNVIMSYEDRPHNYDAWDINHYYTEKAWEVDDVTSVSVEEQGPVRACVRFERKYLESTVVQYDIFYRDLCQIDIAMRSTGMRKKSFSVHISRSIFIQTRQLMRSSMEM